MTRPLLIVLLFALPLLAGCAAQQPMRLVSPNAPIAETRVAESDAAGRDGGVDESCASDADCAVKNVGNCCGYYPACVNRDSPTFPEQVRAACEREGRSSICGFEEISGCRCVDSVCRPEASAGR